MDFLLDELSLPNRLALFMCVCAFAFMFPFCISTSTTTLFPYQNIIKSGHTKKSSHYMKKRVYFASQQLAVADVRCCFTLKMYLGLIWTIYFYCFVFCTQKELKMGSFVSANTLYQQHIAAAAGQVESSPVIQPLPKRKVEKRFSQSCEVNGCGGLQASKQANPNRSELLTIKAQVP